MKTQISVYGDKITSHSPVIKPKKMESFDK